MASPITPAKTPSKYPNEDLNYYYYYYYYYYYHHHHHSPMVAHSGLTRPAAPRIFGRTKEERVW